MAEFKKKILFISSGLEFTAKLLDMESYTGEDCGKEAVYEVSGGDIESSLCVKVYEAVEEDGCWYDIHNNKRDIRDEEDPLDGGLFEEIEDIQEAIHAGLAAVADFANKTQIMEAVIVDKKLVALKDYLPIEEPLEIEYKILKNKGLDEPEAKTYHLYVNDDISMLGHDEGNGNIAFTHCHPEYTRLAKLLNVGVLNIASENSLEEILGVSDEAWGKVIEANDKLKKKGLELEVYMTSEEYDYEEIEYMSKEIEVKDNKAINLYDGAAMYEGLVKKGETFCLDRTGCYCDLSSVLSDLVSMYEDMAEELSEALDENAPIFGLKEAVDAVNKMNGSGAAPAPR